MRVWRIILAAFLTTYARMAGGYDLHIGDVTVALQNSCSTEHKLNVKIGDQVLCAPMTADTVAEKSLRVKLNDTVYTVCNGTCGGGGGGEYVMPETPPVPAQLPTSCTWTQSNSNAYLLSDGNQYFDTGVTADTSVNIDVQVQVINGLSARIFGTNSSSCWFDMTLDHKRRAQLRFGSVNNAASTNFTEANSKKILRFVTSDSSSTKKRIDYYLNGVKQSYFTRTYSACTSSDTLKIFKNNLISAGLVDQTDSGGMKLYYIKVYNKNGTLIHDFQPVAAGTNICGTIAATNAMWDFVDKTLYYPAGTGSMGYGVDP